MGKGLWPAAIPKTSSNAKQPIQTARYQAKRLDAKSMDVVSDNVKGGTPRRRYLALLFANVVVVPCPVNRHHPESIDRADADAQP
ncbi:MAG: hypothetical protein DRJ61_13765 [Acidobacteria bacterium]|nr:MAG: hypothetical protein DRJ61_13765 [Acidobacteriota bacterium]